MRSIRNAIQNSYAASRSMAVRLVLYWFIMALLLVAAILSILMATGVLSHPARQLASALDIQQKNTYAALDAQMDELTAHSVAISEKLGRELDTFLAPNGVLLYLDEIQYFNKKQQQSLLEFLENGKITMIASTTENPYFYIYNALLSRSTVFEFKPLTVEETIPAVERALRIEQERSPLPFTWEDTVPRTVASGCGGDVRKAINAVELLYRGARTVDGGLYVTRDDALQLSQRSAMRYDREGDDHYDLLSALQKSIRGSDPDAAVYYLGRLLVAGDLLSPCRRLLVIAAEDIGLAYPQGIVVTKACVDAALQLGLPEARLPLAEAAVLLATAPKSNSAHNAIIAAMADIQNGAVGEIPRHLKNVHADSAGSAKPDAYKYPHNYPNHYVKQRYLPEVMGDKTYYEYGPNKTEQAAKRYWDDIKGT